MQRMPLEMLRTLLIPVIIPLVLGICLLYLENSLVLERALLIIFLIVLIPLFSVFVFIRKLQSWALILLGLLILSGGIVGSFKVVIPFPETATVQDTIVFSFIGLMIFLSGLYQLTQYHIYIDRIHLFGMWNRPDFENETVANREYIGVHKNKHLQGTHEDSELISICIDKTNVQKLHFVGLYNHRSRCLFYTEILTHPSLKIYFREDTPTARQEHYEHIGRQFHPMVEQLNQYLAHLESGNLVRTVFDVEQGGLFYYRVSSKYYLVGVTLIQTMMDDCDKEMKELVTEVRRYYGLEDVVIKK
ncbi:MAG: hypothetical protein AAF639_07620 [Chloroflexota bacterium]